MREPARRDVIATVRRVTPLDPDHPQLLLETGDHAVEQVGGDDVEVLEPLGALP